MWDCIGYQGECTTSTPAPPSPLHPLTCIRSSDRMVKELRVLGWVGLPSVGNTSHDVTCRLRDRLGTGYVFASLQTVIIRLASQLQLIVLCRHSNTLSQPCIPTPPHAQCLLMYITSSFAGAI